MMIRDLQELEDPQVGGDLWLERLDYLGEHAWGLAADLLEQRLGREFRCGPELARLMALTELEKVTESEFATLREHIVGKRARPDPMEEAFRMLSGTFIP